MTLTYRHGPSEATTTGLHIELLDETALTELGGGGASPADRLLHAVAKAAGGLAPRSAGSAGRLICGLGRASAKTCFAAGRKLSQALRERGVSEAVTVDAAAAGLDADRLECFARGLLVGDYVLADFRGQGDARPAEGAAVTLTAALPQERGERLVRRAEAEAHGQLAAMRLVDRPANFKKPNMVAEYCRQLGSAYGFGVEVVEAAGLAEAGFEGILSVGRASAHPPCLVKLRYDGGGDYALGLVGKGITFDTGGISIKPSANLGAMKSDLGGAAAVLGTFVAAARRGTAVRLHGLLPVAENMIDGSAYLPSDVITNYGGKTIEITDTDAEGRIVLADALAYMNEFAGTGFLTIDLATLTGSAVRTFGYACGAMFTHDTEAAAALSAAGEACGERLWPLPLWDDEYADELKSDVADVKHFSGKPIAGAINAAKFLEAFAPDPQRWVHLDIAGVAFGNSEFTRDRAATGYGVALLTTFIDGQLAGGVGE